MGQALITGLRAAGVASGRLRVVESNPAIRRRVSRRHRVVMTTLEQVARRCDVVIVAVKPQDIRPVLEQLASGLHAHRRRALVISIAAGVTLTALERILGRTAVIRVMPNLPAKVGCGISVTVAGRFATSFHRTLARAIFACVGEVVELPERLFDVVTAISGSGPAYFFAIFQALRDAGVRQGLPKAVAQRLAVRTALGSAQLVDRLREDVDALIAQVASKRGTTEAALKVFRQRHLARIIEAGVFAATRRSQELSR